MEFHGFRVPPRMRLLMYSQQIAHVLNQSIVEVCVQPTYRYPREQIHASRINQKLCRFLCPPTRPMHWLHPWCIFQPSTGHTLRPCGRHQEPQGLAIEVIGRPLFLAEATVMQRPPMCLSLFRCRTCVFFVSGEISYTVGPQLAS